jgi:hypothetical protein
VQSAVHREIAMATAQAPEPVALAVGRTEERTTTARASAGTLAAGRRGTAMVTATAGVARLADAGTGMAFVRPVPGERAAGPALGCRRCRPALPLISWILRHVPA